MTSETKWTHQNNTHTTDK